MKDNYIRIGRVGIIFSFYFLNLLEYFIIFN